MSNLAATTTRDMNASASQASRSNTVKNIAELAGRSFLSVLFLLSGLGKIGAYAATAAYMSSVGVPRACFALLILTNNLFVGDNYWRLT